MRTSIMGAIFVLHLSACGADHRDSDTPPGAIPGTDSSELRTLTITKVKKPWYAWKGLVVGRMRESLPEYSSIQGLRHKYYTFTDDHRYLGGIYFWDSPNSAKKQFDEAWYARTEKKYGKRGVVLTFDIVGIRNHSLPSGKSKDMVSVLTYPKTSTFNSDASPGNPYQVVDLKDSEGRVCQLSLWANREAAVAVLDASKGGHEFFEVPIILNVGK
jgi:hypothetical protein